MFKYLFFLIPVMLVVFLYIVGQQSNFNKTMNIQTTKFNRDWNNFNNNF